MSLPAPVCQELGLQPGTALTVVVDEAGLHLTTTEQALRLAQDVFSPYLRPGETPSEELVRQRRDEAAHE